MRLAEAIRAGHPLIGEDRNRFLQDGCGCALGAAWVGLYGLPERNIVNSLVVDNCHTGFLLESDAVLECPCCVDYEDNAIDLVSHIHFTHGWPRLQIADWLDEVFIGLTLTLPAPVRAEGVTV